MRFRAVELAAKKGSYSMKKDNLHEFINRY